MATNDFIGFASSGSANIASQADYAAAAEQGIGVQPGPASSKLANKVWRQGANMAAALGGMIAAYNNNAYDNGDIGALQTSLIASLKSLVADAIIKGTFTPTVRGGTTDGSFTYTEQVGNYEFLGDLCYINFSVTVSVVSVPSGYVYIDGLPFIGKSANQSLSLNLTTDINDIYNNSPFALRVSSNSASASLYGSIVGSTGVQATKFGSAVVVGTNFTIRANGLYKVAL